MSRALQRCFLRSSALALATVSVLAGDGTPPPTEPSLLGRAYPLEADVSWPAAVFHWVDSLAGTSGGKTIPAYQREFVEKFGRPAEEDLLHIRRFAEARSGHAAHLKDGRGRGQETALPTGSAMLATFCSSRTVEDALARLRDELPASGVEALRSALEHFRPRYEQVWESGRIAREFLERARRDRSVRAALGRLLGRVARFFDVDPRQAEAPRLVLVPVPHGFGTHAEAVGRYLLIEIRPGESLADQTSPIVHENAHYLWRLLPPERLERLRATAAAQGSSGARAWRLLHEALPTALGQGVADRALRSGWSLGARWYHRDDVDAYAKAIFPLVARAIEQGERLDEALVRQLVSVEVTPR